MLDRVFFDTIDNQHFYNRYGILSADGMSRPFDKNASGFVRAETMSAIFLQRQKDSKRVYAQVLRTMTNNDGYKEEGSSFPSRVMQQKLMEELFIDVKIDPATVGYVEAHCTGTIKGDPEEVAAIDQVFCRSENRQEPLQIGSVKSNMGHAEAASAMASIAKIIFAFESGKIAPNINLVDERDDIPALAEKRIKVVTDTEDLHGSLIALNSFGLGGANAHCLFKRNEKEKINNSLPNDDLSRLVCWSGRTEEAVKSIFEDLTKRPLDAEFVALLHNTQRITNSLNVYRGHGIFRHNAELGKAECKKSSIALFNTETRPIVFVYTGMGCQWLEMGKDLMKISTFAAAINKSHDILTSRGVDLKNIITSKDEKMFDNILNSYVAITAIEVALTDVLSSLNIKPDFIVGHSLGELACAYADGCFTLEETILAAHARGEASLKSTNIQGAMAAVGMNYREVEKIIPDDVDIACHNSTDSTTVSGPAESVKTFINELSAKNIFAKEVACSGIPLHSRYIKQMGTNLKRNLNEVIRSPKKRSPKWLSSCFKEEMWNELECQFSSSDYHTQNLLNPVLFEEVLAKLPENSLMIEIAPHCLLQSILKRSIKNGAFIGLARRNNLNGCELLMEELAKLFENGVDIDVAKLYPAIEFPVSRNTPKIASLIKWDHSENHLVPHAEPLFAYERRYVALSLKEKAFEFVQDHIIDGRVIFPGTGWLCLVWETFAMANSMQQINMKIEFEDVEMLRATSMKKDQVVTVLVSIHRSSGRFEVTEGKSAIARGVIRYVDQVKLTNITVPQDNDEAVMLNSQDFYKEMKIRGYHHRGIFRGVESIRNDGLKGKAKWNDNWTTFIDSVMQFIALHRDTRMLALPKKIRKIIIDPELHFKAIEQSNDGILDVKACPHLKVVQSGGVEIRGFEESSVQRRKPAVDPVLEIHRFVAHCGHEKLSRADAAKVFVQLALENNPTRKFTCVEVDSTAVVKAPFASEVSKALNDLPSITHDIVHLTSKSVEIDSVSVQDKDLSLFSNVHLLITSNGINDHNFIQNARSTLHTNGFILSRESALELQACDELEMIMKVKVDDEVIFMLQFADKPKSGAQNVIKITPNVTDWLEPLKESLKHGPTLIYSENEPISGILGLVNCIRYEPNSHNLCCVFIDDDSAPKFDINSKFYQLQLRLGLNTNVYRSGMWGTYRHLQISKSLEEKPRTGHLFVNCQTRGDLSSLQWNYGPLNVNNRLQDAIRISYAALNFRDVMLATNKMNSDDVFSRIQQECVYGFEFSGIDKEGQRKMGFGLFGGLATYCDPDEFSIWDVPDNWSLEDAATVPLVYYTVYSAFFNVSQIKAGQSVLIHAGSGGVGTAAIQIAFAYGLDVFTTVSTDQKRQYLLDRFPKLKPHHVGNSRDASFEQMIFEQTNGHGVDFVLNSLSDELLQASIRCLAHNGTFLEIGKYDLLNKTKIHMGHLLKRISFKAVFFDDFYKGTSIWDKVSWLVIRNL